MTTHIEFDLTPDNLEKIAERIKALQRLGDVTITINIHLKKKDIFRKT